MQVLSHILHPLKGVKPLSLPAPIRGIYLVSPWVSLTTKEGHPADATDIITSYNLAEWGKEVLRDVPSSQNVYAEAVNAPESWFKGVDKVVERVLITAGGAECLKDDIVRFDNLLRKHHQKVDLVIQKGGVHDDPFIDFMLGNGNTKLVDVTAVIIEWMFRGFNQ